MTNLSTLTTILGHAPLWVWVLLKTLLILGLAQARPRTVSRTLALAFPAVMAVLSLVAAETGLGRPAATAAAWVAGAIAAVAVARAIGWPRGVAPQASGRVFMPGSWVPLALFMGLFVLKFFVGASQAMHLPLVSSPLFAPGMGFAYGAFSGVFVARGLAVLQAVAPGVVRLLRPANVA